MSHRTGPMDEVGRGNYSVVVKSRVHGRRCVVKIVKPYVLRSRAGEELKAAQEQSFDVNIEVACLLSPELQGALSWRFTPTCFGAITAQDLHAGGRLAHVCTADLGYVPAALVYMEHLPIQLDVYCDRLIESRASSASEIASLIAELLAAKCALQSLGLRHNDLMFRNVMLRRRRRSANDVADGMRTVALASGSIFRWRACSAYEVVVIDFGLASASRPESLSLGEVAHDIPSHAERESQFRPSTATLTKPQVCVPIVGSSIPAALAVHPMELPLPPYAVPYVDLICIAYGVRTIGRRCLKMCKGVSAGSRSEVTRILNFCKAFGTTICRNMSRKHSLDTALLDLLTQTTSVMVETRSSAGR